MQLETYQTNDASVLRVVSERIDAAVAVQFRDAVRDAANDFSHRIILDLELVTFLDSSGLGAVIGAMKQLAPRQSLELAALQPAVVKVFQLTHMDTIFTIHQTVPGLVASPGDRPGNAHA